MQGFTLAFDLDGTLVDTAPDLVRAVNHVLGRSGYADVPGAAVRPAVSFGARAMIERGLAINGVTASVSQVDEMLDVFLAYYADNIAEESRPFPALEAVLDRAAAAGARLAVCTNKRVDLSIKLLDALGMSPRFDAICGRDTFAVCKPHPGHLPGAREMAGGRPERAVMVGDSDTDVSTARAAGIPIIGVSFGYTDVPMRDLSPDALIDHYDEFEAALARILAAA